MKVIIFGIGDLSKQLLFYLEKENINVEGFCVNKKYYTSEFFCSKKVFIFEDELDNLSPKIYKFIIGIGYKSLRSRKIVFEQIKEKGFDLINYVHPEAKIEGDIIGEGNIILSNVVVEPFARINNNNIIWSNNLICHDAEIGNHNFIAAGSLIGGFSRVLDNNFIGFNSTVIQNITIHKEVLIGARSLVISSPQNNYVYFGMPAKKIKPIPHDGISII